MVEAQNVLTNNPAGRLYEILAKAMKIGNELGNGPYSGAIPEKRKVISVLAKALEMNKTDPSEIFNGISNFFRLMNDTELAINKLQDVDTELYLSPIIEIKEVFSSLSFNLTQDWSQLTVKIDRSILIP